jgi:hypothetical protein
MAMEGRGESVSKERALLIERESFAQLFAGIERELRALSVMLRFSLVLVVLMLLGLPAEAQQGRNDYPDIIPHDWTLLLKL